MSEILKFETETCSRCGGCGEYSYCEMYGRTCFKCHGKGIQLTKRAAKALAWMNEQKKIKCQDVKPGMRVKISGVGTFTVTKSEMTPESQWGKSLQPDGSWKVCPGWDIGGEPSWAGIRAFPEYEIQNIGTKAEQIALIRQAIEYQNSLTKAGTPRKQKMEAAQ